ncbi:MAG: hydrogen gas-evolving membrane-bound hydrogenase subunit E [Candidatus Neomarinimicrobiota bacterium]
MPVESWLIFLLSFMIVGSIIALEMKDLLSAVISIGVVGLGVSVAFLLLQAPDLAVVQFLFEIFSIVIMVRAFIKKDYHREEPSRVNKILAGVTLITLIAVFFLSVPLFKLLPAFGEPLMTTSRYYLENGAAETGSANIISAVILDYRAYDTLGETTVLFTAILGTLTIIRIKKRSKVAEEEKP